MEALGKCNHFAPRSVRFGGSGTSEESSKEFDFESPPGSASRCIRPRSYHTFTPVNNPLQKYIDATADIIFAQTFEQFK